MLVINIFKVSLVFQQIREVRLKLKALLAKLQLSMFILRAITNNSTQQKRLTAGGADENTIGCSFF